MVVLCAASLLSVAAGRLPSASRATAEPWSTMGNRFAVADAIGL